MDAQGNVISVIGGPGREHGKFKYAYDVAVDTSDNLYVCEYGNARVQKFSPDGEFLAAWGKPARDLSGLWCPWAVALDSRDRIFVADTNNQRIVCLASLPPKEEAVAAQ
jgi:hypothetical protein